ncbi:DUF4129 domain-containing protein [Fodinicola feengrottensis]|nr:DUF4129 domain-containing protein [Fodinicola feengrottensis]
MDWLSRHLSPGTQGSAANNWLLLIVVVAVFLLVAVLIWRYGLPAKTIRGGEPELKLGTGTADSHTNLADRYAADGRYAEAVRERLRAIVRSLEQRDLLDPRPGRTVTEIVAAVRRSLPDATDRLREGAQLFSDIWYGSRTASAADDATMREVFATVAAAKPSVSTDELVGAGWALPGSETDNGDEAQPR